MPLIIQERSKAEDYTVVADDTLESIATAKCAALGWKTLALYNFGTARPEEVRRALAETVGVSVLQLNDNSLDATPEKLKLAPDADLKPKLKIPKAYEVDGLATQKTHTVNVNPLKPANAVRILELDKWFIPDKEQCAVRYELQGEGARADKLGFEVFANQYCEATDWNKGMGTFGDPAAFIDKPVTLIDVSSQASERSSNALPGDGWKGQVTTTEGMLGRKTGSATLRHVNVAFSPYTAHFRYFKADGDKTAHLRLEPFWPQWEHDASQPAVTQAASGANIRITWTNAAKADHGVVEVIDAVGQRVHLAILTTAQLAAGSQNLDWDKAYLPGVYNGRFQHSHLDDSAIDVKTLVFKSTPYVYKVTTFKAKKKADSLKIKWEVRHTGKLEEGQLEVLDGKGKLVFQKPLAKAKLGAGAQDFTWDGKYATGIKNSENTDEIIPADMPYRVRLQAHTGINQPEGLAVAVMHTEVRLYTHQQCFAANDLRGSPGTSKPALHLGLGPLVPGDPPAEGAATWTRYKLAEAGFHPGPVTAGGAGTSVYQTALREFKRSVPANGGAVAPNFTRQNLSGGGDIAENAELTTAIKTLRASDQRSWFGDPAQILGNSDAPDLSLADAATRLRDPEQQLAVWVDDRQYYTADPGNCLDDTGANYFSGTASSSSFGMLDYRGGMSNADGKVTTDAASVARPWLPLKAQLSLLSRSDELNPAFDASKLNITDAGMRTATDRAIGPIRVDWACEEIGADVEPINTGMANYNKDFVRSRFHVGFTLHDQAAGHSPADLGRPLRYSNCPEALGGSRPASLASYAAKVFGAGELSLAPWTAEAVAATESVMSVVHDHLSAGQVAKTDLFEPLIGSAGAYFNPSRIAGDGYRVRAQVRFEKAGAYAFPNVDALKARYPVTPQAYTGRLRLWRRTSFRGYLCWGAATGNWGASFINAFRDHYRGGHVYFVHEGGAAQTFSIADVFDPAQVPHQTKYKQIISKNVTDVTLQDITRMTLKADQIWPWSGRTDMGWSAPSAMLTATNGAAVVSGFENALYNATWRKFRYALITALVKEVERKGFMRGHLMVEFVASEACCYQVYRCNNGAGAHSFLYLEKGASPGTRMNGQACPAPGCGTAGNVLSSAGQGAVDRTALGLPAVGSALGATWLFWQGENIERLKGVWAHEVMHHRHGEHAASAPGAADGLHDAQPNTRYTAGWAALGTSTVAADQRWDRRCAMSYSDVYGELGCFCGKCLLRNRGWMVAGLTAPPGDHNEA